MDLEEQLQVLINDRAISTPWLGVYPDDKLDFVCTRHLEDRLKWMFSSLAATMSSLSFSVEHQCWRKEWTPEA